ncbi:WXG100 family type VII secretion target [Actinosynnema mirum]|uniref:Uncharacterized protein n=1 Tax=Actinosynnema mirum (strain ATCC 29888 / DSM 43827 / JCM 3225 / NBRC 14064 / NCIMB 13271 / NRRL B-12336 / IMRU 3971 / 101) TaxID=446462 RepID=C6WD38_ACTMD|nr:hypothetical protein [Actinosynnema mirum]ACU37657.1 hypothetical protein Amir_3775 [Actinosynnema mirum DSM 43827]
MFKDMDVDTRALGDSAQSIQETGAALANDLASFRGQVDALASAFGGDELGSALATIYQVVSEAAFESFGDNAEALGEIGLNLQGMADDYSATETAASDAFHLLMGNLG